MPKKIDYKALYNEQLKLNKELKLHGTFAVTDACYMCRNMIGTKTIIPDVCKQCHVEKHRRLVRE